MSKFNNLVYDDLQVSVSAARIPTANAPTWVDWDFGIAGGVEFPVLAWDVGDLFYFYIQTTHSTKLSTIIDHHMHFSIADDIFFVDGVSFRFQLDVVGAPINSAWAALASSPFTATYTIGTLSANKHLYLDLADLDAINTTVSTLYICKLSRTAVASGPEYGGNVYMVFTDSHTRRDSNGSIAEASK